MSDQLDPALRALFAQTRPEVVDDGFTAQVVQRVQREVRMRAVWRVVALGALLAALAYVMPSIDAAMSAVLNRIGVLDPQIAWSIGVCLSLSVAGFVLWRARVFRRG